MRHPCNIQLILKAEIKFQVFSSFKLIEYHSIIDTFDLSLFAIVEIEKIFAFLGNIGQTDGLYPDICIAAFKIYSCLLIIGLNFKKYDILGFGIADYNSF